MGSPIKPGQLESDKEREAVQSSHVSGTWRVDVAHEAKCHECMSMASAVTGIRAASSVRAARSASEFKMMECYL